MPAGAHRNQQKKIDSNNIATVFRKGNAITKLLTDALEKENAGETGVYYWKKTEARDLFESAGVQFTGGSMQDGLIHSIFDAGSPVNRKYVKQTEIRKNDPPHGGDYGFFGAGSYLRTIRACKKVQLGSSVLIAFQSVQSAPAENGSKAKRHRCCA